MSSVSSSTNSLPDSRMDFIRMRRKGIPSQSFLQEKIEYQVKSLLYETATIANTLASNQQEAKLMIGDLIQDVVNMDVFRASKFQKDNLTDEIKGLQKIQAKLADALQTSEQELVLKRQEKGILNAKLTQYCHLLKLSPHKHHFNAPLNQIGNNLSKYISNETKNKVL